MHPDSKYKRPWRTFSVRDSRSKLSTVQKVEIQRRRWEGESASVLAEEFGVSRSTIYNQPAWDGKL